MNDMFDRLDARTEITFGLIGDHLSVGEVGQSIGIEPTRAFEKGDFFIGSQRIEGKMVDIERQRPRGVWQLSTLATVKTDIIVDHAESLLSQLEPKADAINTLKESQSLFSRISICHVGGGTFELPSDIMKRIALLCEEVSVTCWENDEQDI